MPPLMNSKDSLISSLEALRITKEAQQQHGLRHLDYNRYKSYCTRRLRRLRKTLNLVYGHQRRFQKKEINIDEINDIKFLLIPLFQAERAWAYALQLKQESNNEQRKKYHVLNRLRKAVKHSNELEKWSAKFDARSKLEAQGYHAWIKGQLYFEIQNWEDSLKHFNIAKEIYQKLSTALVNDDIKLLYLHKANEMDPNIRYCAYNIGDESAIQDLVEMKLKSTGYELTENIDSLISQAKEKQIMTFSEVHWKDKTLQIKNEKVRLFLLNVQEYENQIKSSENLEIKSTIYDKILKDSVDAIQAIRDELKTDSGFKAYQRNQSLEEKPSNLLLLFFYLTYIRLRKTVERNMIMIAQLGANDNVDGFKVARPQDIIRLYDIVIQNCYELSALPPLNQDIDAKNDYAAIIIFFSAFRAYFISVFYLNNKKYKEAAGFILKTEAYVNQLKNQYLKKLAKTMELSEQVLDDKILKLKADLNNTKYKLQSVSILEDSEPPEHNRKMNEKTWNVEDRCDKFINIVKMPPQLQPILCKSLYFDLALNHVQLPTLEDKTDNKIAQPSSSFKSIAKFLGFK